VGTALRDSPIRKELNIIVVVVRRASGEFIYNPSSTLEFESGDRLISIGDREALGHLAELSTGEGRSGSGRGG
jgi:voltage-gated potassium channel